MKQAVAHRITVGDHRVEWHYTTGQVEDLHLTAGHFSWIRGIFGLPYGLCYLDKREAIEGGIMHTYEYMTDLRLTVRRVLTEAGYIEQYEWQNVGKKPIAIKDAEVGVYATFAEKYDIEQVAVPYRAYTHIMAAGSAFYMYNARMNGQSDGVGLVLTQGRVGQVVYERLHPAERGDIALTLPACTLQPEEKCTWQWLVFAYADSAEFWQVVRGYTHQIVLSTLHPAAEQSVAVTVDGVMPHHVLVDGVEQANPFVAPVGAFTLQPVADCPDISLPMSGEPEVVHWVRCYRHWGVGRANPRRHITDCNMHYALYCQTGDKQQLTEAQQALFAYYRGVGATRHPQVGIPAEVVQTDPRLCALFDRHVQGVLRAKGRYTAQRVWATYRMLQVADTVFDGRYRQALAEAEQRAYPLLNTPFGSMFEQS